MWVMVWVKPLAGLAQDVQPCLPVVVDGIDRLAPVAPLTDVVERAGKLDARGRAMGRVCSLGTHGTRPRNADSIYSLSRYVPPATLFALRDVRCPIMRQVVISRGEDGYWVAECPSLPGCISQGRTREDAIQNIKEAIEGYVATLEEDGLDVPEDHFDTLLVAV